MGDSVAVIEYGPWLPTWAGSGGLVGEKCEVRTGAVQVSLLLKRQLWGKTNSTVELGFQCRPVRRTAGYVSDTTVREESLERGGLTGVYWSASGAASDPVEYHGKYRRSSQRLHSSPASLD